MMCSEAEPACQPVWSAAVSGQRKARLRCSNGEEACGRVVLMLLPREFSRALTRVLNGVYYEGTLEAK